MRASRVPRVADPQTEMDIRSARARGCMDLSPLRTLRDVAKDLNVTHERVRQIEKKALDKIIAGFMEDDMLRPFLEDDPTAVVI